MAAGAPKLPRSRSEIRHVRDEFSSAIRVQIEVGQSSRAGTSTFYRCAARFDRSVPAGAFVRHDLL
jgi:hypothetical protein